MKIKNKQRSRHSSGASNISLRGKGLNSNDLTGDVTGGRKGSVSEQNTTTGAVPGTTAGAGVSAKAKMTEPPPEEEEGWHVALRQRFIGEYKGYLVKELGFIPLIVQPTMTKG